MIEFQSVDLIALFFIFGLLAGLLRADFKIPEPVSQFLSIFLLLVIGLKGGREVRSAESLDGFLLVLSIGLVGSFLIGAGLYYALQKFLSRANAAALAACYGSVSAVTYVTATGFLDSQNIAYSGYMVAVMAFMEIPAIITALVLYQRQHSNLDQKTDAINFKQVLRSVLTMKSVLLLMGGFIVGLLLNDLTWLSLKPAMIGGFKGVLAFFLIDVGLLAASQVKSLRQSKRVILFVGLGLPLVHGLLTLIVTKAFGLPDGDSVLLSLLMGSASYIAAPAAIRQVVPTASPALFVSLPLVLTFPLNVFIALPLYVHLLKNF
jgi:uncharacterized protein